MTRQEYRELAGWDGSVDLDGLPEEQRIACAEHIEKSWERARAAAVGRFLLEALPEAFTEGKSGVAESRAVGRRVLRVIKEVGGV